MSRKASGAPEAVERAFVTAKTAETAAELRQALSVLLPVMHSLSLKETAALIGRSVTWVAKERLNFIQERPNSNESAERGGRRNQLIPADEEDAFVELVCQRYIRVHSDWRTGRTRGAVAYQWVNMSFVEFAHAQLEDHIQRKTTRTTVYNLLSRTGKRRFASYRPHLWTVACARHI